MPFTRDDDLRLAVRLGQSKGLRLVRSLRRQPDEDDRTRIAEAIRLHLVLGAGGSSPDRASAVTATS